jgi:hypothetical protein
MSFQRSLNLALETIDLAFPAVVDQLHRPGLAGLEAHGRAGGDVEPACPRGGPVEIQRQVGFAKW